jgi:hypothetical protein
VTTSPRNEGLAVGIADAFIKAVLQLCSHDTLQYQWMRYLPDADGYPWDGFWKGVISKIKDRIMSTSVLRPANEGPLRLIRNSRAHTNMELDRFGNPLFPDTTPELYLSLRYQAADLDRLRDFGLESTRMMEIIVRAEHDLAAWNSRMKSTVDQDWHSRAAKMLQFPFRRSGWSESRKGVTRLSLLPLRNALWTSIISRSVYYPKAKGTELEIPSDLNFRVIDSVAVANPDRRRLFDDLGVKSASVSSIRDAIVGEHQETQRITLSNAVYHLRFLYLTQPLAKPPYVYHPIRIFSHYEKLEGIGADLYIRDNDPYGAANLLKPTAPGLDAGSGAPGFDVLFINEAYFQEPPSPPTTASQSWKDWLHSAFSVRRHLRLLSKDELEISAICKYVAEHRPEKFLSFVRTTWELEAPKDKGEADTITEQLGQVRVLCQGNGIQMRPLNTTYLPIRKLVELCDRFMLDSEFFPWLKLEAPLSHDTVPLEWEAIGKAFGLGFDQPVLEFTLKFLTYILDAYPSAEDLVNPQRIYDLYDYLEAKAYESRNSLECATKIR